MKVCVGRSDQPLTQRLCVLQPVKSKELYWMTYSSKLLQIALRWKIITLIKNLDWILKDLISHQAKKLWYEAVKGCRSDRFKSPNCCRNSRPDMLPVSSWVRHLTFGSAGLWFNTAGGFVSLHLGQRNTSERKASKSACWDKRMSWPSVTFQKSQVVLSCQSVRCPRTELHVDGQPADGRIASLWVQPTSCTDVASEPVCQLRHYLTPVWFHYTGSREKIRLTHSAAALTVK